jgi:RNA polymerase sigma factor (sigma-70 family)
MTETDLELLARYARQNAEDAFAEIVRRYINLVHSAAVRQVRSSQLAEEVAQTTFIALAREAHRLAPDTILAAWLYKVAHRTAANVVRRETRRQLREHVAMEINATNNDPDWAGVEPLLDEAMHALDDTDRAAVLLRYFENKSLREVGAALGTTENAAQKRLGRAVERLREFFTKRGVTTGASGLVIVISANAVQAAPVGLALMISKLIPLPFPAIVAASTTTATKAIAMTTTQKALVAAALAVAVGTAVFEVRQAAISRNQITRLDAQQALLAQQNERLIAENAALTNQFARLLDENSRLKDGSAELARLRAQATQFRQANTDAKRLTDPLGSAALVWMKQAELLKFKFEEMPDKKIPELQFLSEVDWLGPAPMPPGAMEGWNEKTWRNKMAELRRTAKDNAAHRLGDALQLFIGDHDGQLPDELSQLNAYYKSYAGKPASLDAAILARYELLKKGNLRDLDWNTPLIVEKAPPVDEDYDTRFQYTASGCSYQGVGAASKELQGNCSFGNLARIYKYRKKEP